MHLHECPGCGVEFESPRKDSIYCSRSCRSRANAKPPSVGYRAVHQPTGYVRVVMEDGSRELEHRIVWSMNYGPIPPGGMIHHRNHDKTDNRVENLQLVMNNKEHTAAHGGRTREYTSKVAECHPDRKHRSLGLCLACYMKHRRALAREC